MLQVGYLLPSRDAVVAGDEDPRALVELARRAEVAGFDSVWAGDSPVARPRADAVALLAAAAAVTTRVTLGTAVILPALRQPVLLAHQLATLDALSGGRLVVGVGSGFPYPPTEAQFRAVEKDFDRRVPAMEEAIEAMRALWRSADAPVSYEGESISFSDVLIRPRPAREGGPPIWMAGAGRIAEARAGRLGDGWLPYPPEARLYRDGLERVRNAARHSNRAEPTGALYATITLQRGARSAGEALRESVERYYDAPLAALARIQALRAGAADEIAGWLREYVLLGARHLVLRFADPDPLTALEQAGRELLPLLRDIEKEIR